MASRVAPHRGCRHARARARASGRRRDAASRGDPSAARRAARARPDRARWSCTAASAPGSRTCTEAVDSIERSRGSEDPRVARARERRERRDRQPPQPAARRCPAAGADRRRTERRRLNGRICMTTPYSPATAPDELTAEQLELQQRARDVRRGRADPARARGRAARRPAARGRRSTASSEEAIAARLHGGRHSPEHGGQGWSMLEWFLVNEQFGRVTNGLHWHVPNAYNVLDPGHARAGRALPAAGAARRGRRRLRGHRGRRRFGPVRDRDDGRALPTAAGVIERREVVRHLGRRRRGADRDGERRRRTASACRRCSWSSRTRPASSSSTTRSSRTTIRTATRRSASPTSRSARRRGDRRHRQRRRRSSAPGSPRSGSASRPTGSARCGGCSTRRPPGRIDARPGRQPDHGLPGDLVPAGRLGDRRHRRAGCWRCTSRAMVDAERRPRS